MHEGAIVSSLFRTAEEIRENEGLEKITLVRIVIGQFHQIVPDVMKMHFDIMKMEYPGFESSRLEMEERYLVIRCRNCSRKSRLEEPFFVCPDCSSADIDIIRGDELYIASLEGLRNEKETET